jgi:hypothetical protein
MHVDLEPKTAGRSRPAWSTRRRGLVLSVMLFIAALAASSLNPLLAMGTNNRLESRCPTQPDTETRAMEWTYERDSWTPFRWSCDITFSDGKAESYTPWRIWP